MDQGPDAGAPGAASAAGRGAGRAPGVDPVGNAATGATQPIFACPVDLRPDALAVLYRRIPADFRPQVVAEALAEARAGRLDLSGLWVARRRARLVGALLTHTLAGRAAALWAPEVEAIWGRAALAAGLIRAALDDLRGRGVRVAQALVDPSGPSTTEADLDRGGLPRVTTLTFLERGTDLAEPAPRGDLGPPPALGWESLGPGNEAEFRATLEATYAGSLDMPELDGVRSLDDVMASHRAAGRFDPARWSLGRVDGEPDAAAVVLLSEVPDRPAWEVAYLGLTPAARGRGLGLSAIRHARRQAKAAGVDRIELAVDARNLPARRLYAAAGFRPFDRRIVHLAILNRQQPAG